MTQGEFKAWTKIMDGSKHSWTVDECSLQNRKEYLIFRGGERGAYILIDASGKLTLGAYNGAFPHIGEALFIQSFSKQFPSQELALQRVIEAGGLSFLLDFCGATK